MVFYSCPLISTSPLATPTPPHRPRYLEAVRQGDVLRPYRLAISGAQGDAGHIEHRHREIGQVHRAEQDLGQRGILDVLYGPRVKVVEPVPDNRPAQIFIFNRGR